MWTRRRFRGRLSGATSTFVRAADLDLMWIAQPAGVIPYSEHGSASREARWKGGGAQEETETAQRQKSVSSRRISYLNGQRRIFLVRK